ncbi:gp53-like domain-containing protein [Enterobacter hormaechei]|uniref:gp53-like domain-containing protein n=1 Tax=Enterobacter hormaechei TaxID=158836 RepID=UPI001CC31F9F|nr:hypothetical protein [Enterobacter hormaechei]
MSENNYAAMMIKSAVAVGDDINAILSPGIYIIPPANTSSPDATGGVLTVHTGTPIRRTFTSDAVIALTSTRNGGVWTAWKGPLSRTHPGADIKADGVAAVAEFLANIGLGELQTSFTDKTGKIALNGGWGLGIKADQISGTMAGLDVSRFDYFAPSDNLGPYPGQWAGGISFANSGSTGWQICGASLSSVPDFSVRIKASQSTFSDWYKLYHTGFKPTPADINAIQRDACDVAGFISNNQQDPYMRHLASKNLIQLATRKSVDDLSKTVSELNASDVNAIQRDACDVAGFISNNQQDPYMRHLASKNLIQLATRKSVDDLSKTVSELNASDVNAIQRDACDVAGFISNNQQDPYMRHLASKNLIQLATRKSVDDLSKTVSELNASDVNAIQRDACDVAGFISNNQQDPYMRHLASKNLIQLATRKSVTDLSTAVSNFGTAAKKNVGTGAGQIPDMSSFSSGAGWASLPGGTIIQWGIAASGQIGDPQTINFPVPFTNYNTVQLVASYDNAGSSNAPYSFAAQPISNTQFKLLNSTSSAAVIYARWIAIGR